MQQKQNVVLVEWKFEGAKRHKICTTEDELLTTACVLAGLSTVRDVVVWTPELINHLTKIGQCGHA